MTVATFVVIASFFFSWAYLHHPSLLRLLQVLSFGRGCDESARVLALFGGGGAYGHCPVPWSSDWHTLQHESVFLACIVKQRAKRMGSDLAHCFEPNVALSARDHYLIVRAR